MGGAVFLDPFCRTFSRLHGLMTAHAPSAVGVAKAPPPLILFNYIKLQLNPEYQSGHGCPYAPIFPYYLPLALHLGIMPAVAYHSYAPDF